MRYFLGADLGGTKTHFVIADETGRAVGFGESGPANHETVGYDGMTRSMQTALKQALASARLDPAQIAGAGFGIAGYDWPSESPNMLASIAELELSAPTALVNDAIPGLVAGSEAGWGVNVVSGTGCNCRGWDQNHTREGRVTGYGILMGEAAGSVELVNRAMQLVGRAWTLRGPQTELGNLFIDACGAKSLEDLLEGYTKGYYQIGAETAPMIFEAAHNGDQVAKNLIIWAGEELGEMANSVIRQIEIEKLEFDVVLSGSMFDGGSLLIDPMRAKILSFAPKARMVRLQVPPVLGAVLIGMEQGQLQPTHEIRNRLKESVQIVRNTNFNVEA